MKNRDESEQVSPPALDLSQEITGRGFGLVTFTDRYGAACQLQMSSLATDEAVWFGVQHAEPKIMASQAWMVGLVTDQETGWVDVPLHDAISLNTRMHLTRDQVRALLPVLQRFADTGELRLWSK